MKFLFKPLCKCSTKQAVLIRAAAWLLVAGVLIWTAKVVDRPIQQQKAMATGNELKTAAAKIWLSQSAQTETINELAAALVMARNLKPGDPLPPSEIHKVILRKQPNRTGISHLDSEEEIHLKTWHVIKTNRLESPVEIILSIRNTVPEKGEPYAATALFGNPEVVEKGMQIHPKDGDAMKLITKTIEQTGGLGVPPK